MNSMTPCYPLMELFRYVDRNGIPTNVQIPDTNHETEEGVIVSVPSRVLKVLRALADGQYIVDGPKGDRSVTRRIVQIAETTLADGFTDDKEAEQTRAYFEKMREVRAKKGAKR